MAKKRERLASSDTSCRKSSRPPHAMCVVNDSLTGASLKDPKALISFHFCRAFIYCPDERAVYTPIKDIFTAYIEFIQSLSADSSFSYVPRYTSSPHFCKSFLKGINNGEGYFSEWGSRKKAGVGMVLDGVTLLSPASNDVPD